MRKIAVMRLSASPAAKFMTQSYQIRLITEHSRNSELASHADHVSQMYSDHQDLISLVNLVQKACKDLTPFSAVCFASEVFWCSSFSSVLADASCVWVPLLILLASVIRKLRP
jgi:hypothetical protein